MIKIFDSVYFDKGDSLKFINKTFTATPTPTPTPTLGTIIPRPNRAYTNWKGGAIFDYSGLNEYSMPSYKSGCCHIIWSDMSLWYMESVSSEPGFFPPITGYGIEYSGGQGEGAFFPWQASSWNPNSGIFVSLLPNPTPTPTISPTVETTATPTLSVTPTLTVTPTPTLAVTSTSTVTPTPTITLTPPIVLTNFQELFNSNVNATSSVSINNEQISLVKLNQPVSGNLITAEFTGYSINDTGKNYVGFYIQNTSTNNWFIWFNENDNSTGLNSLNFSKNNPAIFQKNPGIKDIKCNLFQ